MSLGLFPARLLLSKNFELLVAPALGAVDGVTDSIISMGVKDGRHKLSVEACPLSPGLQALPLITTGLRVDENPAAWGFRQASIALG